MNRPRFVLDSIWLAMMTIRGFKYQSGNLLSFQYPNYKPDSTLHFLY